MLWSCAIYLVHFRVPLGVPWESCQEKFALLWLNVEVKKITTIFKCIKLSVKLNKLILLFNLDTVLGSMNRSHHSTMVHITVLQLLPLIGLSDWSPSQVCFYLFKEENLTIQTDCSVAWKVLGPIVRGIQVMSRNWFQNSTTCLKCLSILMGTDLGDWMTVWRQRAERDFYGMIFK